MQNAPAAAAPVSQPDYFSLFGLKRRFGVDRQALERKFYELSKSMHPDRFTMASPEAMRESLVRMSELNDAYSTLKSPESLREYYLKLEGLDSSTERQSGAAGGAGGPIPMELAESWFELQDAVMEDPKAAAGKVAEFEGQLADLRKQGAEGMTGLECEIDSTADAHGSAPRELLERLSREIRAQSYLKSMERDVERIKARL